MDLTIKILDKDVDRVINQAADTWGYRLQAVITQESKSQFVLRYLKQMLAEAAKQPEKDLVIDQAAKQADDKFNQEVILDTVGAVANEK